ncbi:MAG: tetratricopeptide repeat protein, partial [Paludibacteraceae bacterium]|nr:tetratricopeptide repeat protein [Paludibacteraceae bacterium]
PSRPEYTYQKAMILMELKQWKQAVTCFDNLIESYPYFLPSYYLAAQAKTALGEGKAAYRYRQTAYELEQKKDSIQSAISNQQSTIATGVTVAKSQPQKKDNRKEFSSRAAQNQEEETVQIGSEMRGHIQNKYTDVINEPNIYLSYYQSTISQRAYYPQSTIHNPLFLDLFNRQHVLPAPLHLTTQDITLTAEMVNQHFERINRLTDQINYQQSTTQNSKFIIQNYFERAIEFALVQDYSSAIDDCTKAIQYANASDETSDEIEVVMLFCRANWRYRLYEYQRSSGELTMLSPMDYEIMLRDYDYILRLMPDMTFAYYNKANILCTQKEFNEAIRHYTKATEYDPDFAEAYFNRGLTYIFIGQDKEGLDDLSKAGELGIYQAYNLITRFK